VEEMLDILIGIRFIETDVGILKKMCDAQPQRQRVKVWQCRLLSDGWELGLKISIVRRRTMEMKKPNNEGSEWKTWKRRRCWKKI
jgi:hypothetical protein